METPNYEELFVKTAITPTQSPSLTSLGKWRAARIPDIFASTVFGATSVRSMA
jgi:hypothetical protein